MTEQEIDKDKLEHDKLAAKTDTMIRSMSMPEQILARLSQAYETAYTVRLQVVPTKEGMQVTLVDTEILVSDEEVEETKNE